MKFATKPHNITNLTLEMLLHYLGKLNSKFLQTFGRYGRKCKQVAFLSSLTLLLIQKF